MKVSMESEEAWRRLPWSSTALLRGRPGQQEQVLPEVRANTLGFVAQGSEFGFGQDVCPRGERLHPGAGEDQYIQVVSCNTHNIAVLLNTIALAEHDPSNLVEASSS